MEWKVRYRGSKCILVLPESAMETSVGGYVPIFCPLKKECTGGRGTRHLTAGSKLGKAQDGRPSSA